AQPAVRAVRLRPEPGPPRVGAPAPGGQPGQPPAPGLSRPPLSPTSPLFFSAASVGSADPPTVCWRPAAAAPHTPDTPLEAGGGTTVNRSVSRLCWSWAALAPALVPEALYAQAKVLRADGRMVHALALTADGTLLASGGQGDKLRLWDTRTGKQQAA